MRREIEDIVDTAEEQLRREEAEALKRQIRRKELSGDPAGSGRAWHDLVSGKGVAAFPLYNLVDRS